MTELATRLAGLDPAAQAQLAEERAPGASTEELIDVLADVALGEWAELPVIDELVRRGPPVVEGVVAALRARPLPRSGGLGEILVQLYQRAPAVRGQISAALIAAVDAALNAGGGSRGAAPPIQWLADCARIAGPLPEAAAVSRRLLAVAAAEAAAYLPATAAAESLAGEPPGRA